MAASPIGEIAGFKKSILAKVLFAGALCHDVGKATSYFQSYLLSPVEQKAELRRLRETSHSLLSAVAAYYAVQRQLEEETLAGGERAFLSFLAFLIIRRHHGNLGSVVAEARLSPRDEKLLSKQVAAIDGDKLAVLSDHLKEAGLKQAMAKPQLAAWVLSIRGDLSIVRRKLRRLGRTSNLQYYLLANLLFSHLIDADKSEAAVGKALVRRDDDLSAKLIDAYKAHLRFGKSKINALRERAYQEVLSADINLNERILALNLPTGLGKTFTAFAFAFELRKTIQKKRGRTPRIVYALPFLSVIEQNAAEITKVLEFNEIEPTTDLLLKHHHLAEVSYVRREDEFEAPQAKILMEGWNSEIIITTFAQLFHTLISNKNRSLRKFHRLAGSIIILDEVQSVPVKYWQLIKELFQQLAEKLDSYLVFVTATEPLIFARHEVSELVNRRRYFEQMNRVVMKPRLDKNLELEEFSEGLVLKEGTSYLFILNTINSAKRLYRLLSEKTGEKTAFLSTHVTPFERLARIEMMQKGRVRLAVTTQLVEAGVDIDFDVVYRDLAPLDSLNQAAGRCNRNWGPKGQKGRLVVVALHDGKRLYADYIYDRVLVEITKRILAGQKEIPESRFLELINAYYQEVQEKKSSDRSREFLAAVDKLKYDSVDGTASIGDFRLIEDDYLKLTVFVEINAEAAGIWQKYLQLGEIEDLFQRKAAFDAIKGDFYKFTISIPANTANLPPEVAGFRYINWTSLAEYYDPATGFICEEVISIW